MPPTTELQVKLDKVEQFLEEIRAKSRSRTVSLGLARSIMGLKVSGEQPGPTQHLD